MQKLCREISDKERELCLWGSLLPTSAMLKRTVEREDSSIGRAQPWTKEPLRSGLGHPTLPVAEQTAPTMPAQVGELVTAISSHSSLFLIKLCTGGKKKKERKKGVCTLEMLETIGSCL